MKAIILAAGEGKRMRPLTLERPKPMVEVLGKPLLHHIVDSLPQAITELIFVIGYKGEQIQKYFGDSFERRTVTYITQEKALGTGHALFLCKDLIGESEKFLFMIGDDLHSPQSIKRLCDMDLGMLVHEHPNPKEFGVVEVNEKDEVISFEEKPDLPKSNLVSPAVFILDGRIFKYPLVLHKKGEYFAVDQINQMMKDHKFVVERSNFWHPIGYPHDIEAAEKKLGKDTIPSSVPLIILAGGRGTRLAHEDKPKVLVEIAGKPMLEHQLELAFKQGFTDITLALGHRAQEIIDWLTQSPYSGVRYVIEDKPLGTGGAAKLASEGIRTGFIVINCDDIADVSYAGLVRHASGKYNVISGMEVADASPYGLLECDEYKRVCQYKEKKAGSKGTINIGHYYLQPEVLRYMPEVFSLEYDVFPALAKTENLLLHTHTGNYWFGCGTPESLAATREYFSKTH